MVDGVSGAGDEEGAGVMATTVEDVLATGIGVEVTAVESTSNPTISS